jgi:hypothetical protein
MPLLFIQTVFSPWLILFCLAAAAALTWFLYNRDNAFKDTPRLYIRLLATLRFISMFVILFFLLQPFVRLLKTIAEKPILIFAQDNSSSLVLIEKAAYYQGDYLKRMNSFLDGFRNEADVVLIPFGNVSRPGDTVRFSDQASDYQELMNYIRNTYSNRHVGALVIAGDGIINRGADPSLSDAGFWFPVYTVAMGDTLRQKDIAIKDVMHNKVTYSGNRFVLKAFIVSALGKGEKSILSVSSGSNILFRKELNITSDNWVYELNTDLPAEKAGMMHYTISVTALDGEKNVRNNRQDIWVEVMESRRKVAILYDSPHPDIGAVRQSLAVNRQFETEAFQAGEFRGNIQDYDVVILHQIPSKKYTASDLLRQLVTAEKPVWFIMGSQSNLQQFNSLNTGLKISQSGQVFDEAIPAFAGNFALFRLSDNIPGFVATLPPLIAPYGEYTTPFPQNVLLQQKIKNVVTGRPLVMFTEIPSQGKYAITAGEGIWRWRMKCFSEYSHFDFFDELVSTTVQYLSAGTKKERFNVSIRNTYNSSEPVVAGAELYDKTFKPDNRYDVSMTLTDSSGRNYEYTFTRQDEFYRLSCGILPAGKWKWQAAVNAGSETFRKNGELVVTESMLEDNDLTARHDVMMKLAALNAGFMVNDTAFSQLSDSLKVIPSMKPISHAEYDMFDLIEVTVILLMLVLFLSVEWFFRKFLGSY